MTTNHNNESIFPWLSLNGYLQNAQGLLSRFVEDVDFVSQIKLAFGNDVDIAKAETLIRELAKSNSSILPKIEIRSESEINGAQGAFAAATNTIYLAQEFLESNNTAEITAVLLEEIGHALDFQLNSTDTPGDEGELFSDLVRGVEVYQTELQRLKAEDDSAIVTIDGQTLQIEQSTVNLGLRQGFGFRNDSISRSDSVDYFTFTISAEGDSDNYISVESTFENVDLVLELRDQYGDLLEEADENGDQENYEEISLEGYEPGNYVVVVRNFYGTSFGYPGYASYTLKINAPVPTPDLTLYRPSGWSDRIVISTQPGTNTDSTSITTANTLYIDFAVINQGTAATNRGFSNRLLLSGNGLNNFVLATVPFDALGANLFNFRIDGSFPPLLAGDYTLTLQIDYLGQVVETNENNNVFTKNFTVTNSLPPISTTVAATGNNNIDGLLEGRKWSSIPVTFSFTDSISDYESNYDQNNGNGGRAKYEPSFQTLNTIQRAVARTWIGSGGQYGNVSNLTTVELTGASDRNATLRLAMSNAALPTAYAFTPFNSVEAGDSWYNRNDYNDPVIGNYAYHTFGHELGHSLGLKHGHEAGGVSNVTMNSDRDSMEFSIMTYRSYVGDSTNDGYNNEFWGYAQSLMMYDIRALQEMYGAGFDDNSSNTTYTFSTNSGEMFVNGVGQGTPGANRIFRTIWDGNGIDTYNFSNYTTNLTIDLTPGGWSDLDVGGTFQRANLGNGNYARGQVFNALQYNGDSRSLIENAVGGSGNDGIVGNSANNTLDGGAGNDTLDGGAGNDTLDGGAGANFLRGGIGDDTYYLSAFTAGGSTIQDTSGTDTLYLSNITLSLANLWRSTTSLRIDLNSDGQYISAQDLTLLDFFGTTGAGSGFIETVNNLLGQNILSSFNNVLPSITLTLNPISVLEDGIPNLVYTFTRTGSTTSALTVNYTVGGNATFNNDYTQIGAASFTATIGSITFAAGSSTTTLTIDPTGDTLVEQNETVALTLASGTGYTLGTTTAVTGTITNDDVPSITLTLNPISVLEDGIPNLVYTFTRTGSTTSALTVNYTVGGNATFNNDYTQIGAASFTATIGSITFAAGSSTTTLTIDPTGDTLVEQNETVALTLASGTGYTLGTTTAVTGTITNDDVPSITLTLNPISVLEDGIPNLVYTFTRTGSTTSALTVNYTVGGNATFNNDYTQIGAASFTATIGSITFAAGSSTAILTLDPTPDTLVEQNETVALTLASGTGYTLGTTTAVTGTITNDDVPSITLTLNPISVLEDGIPNLVYTFTRTGSTTSALTVNYTVGGNATFNNDYTQIGAASFTATIGSITFAAGSSTAILTLDPTPDTLVEQNETVALTLASGTGYTLGTTTAVTGTITNDDFPSITLTLNPISVLEDGTPNLVYTFTRTGNTTSALTVNYTVGGDATFNSDYTQIGAASFTATTGSITFAAGSSTAILTLDPTPDTLVEQNETVALTLASGTGYTLGTTTAVTGTITNDDVLAATPTVNLAVSTTTGTEAGTTVITVTATSSSSVVGDKTVNLGVTGIGITPRDYNLSNSTINILNGQSSGSVTFTVINDTLVEGTETATLTLSNPSSGLVLGSTISQNITIIDNDFPTTTPTVNLAVSSTTGTEAGTTVITVTATSSSAVVGLQNVKLSVRGISETSNITSGDYTLSSSTINILNGQTTGSVTFTVVNDTLIEGTETATLTLSNPSSGLILGNTISQNIIITDNEVPAIAPTFALFSTNPFGLTPSGGSFSYPTLTDIDGDGDLDAFVGTEDGNTRFYRNTGNVTSPAFATPSNNPFGLTDVGFSSSPTFADIDGDGDLDAIVGNSDGNTFFYRNTGSATTPAFALPSTNPFGLTDIGSFSSPTLADLDGDGDLDAMVGTEDGNTRFYRNTGNVTSPAFATPSNNPFGLTNVGGYSNPIFADFDGDGDLDAMVGNLDGNTLYYRNTGSTTSPAFAAPSTNPFGLTDVGAYSSPIFADFDGDGDLDALVGNSDGNILYYRNTSSTPVTSTVNLTVSPASVTEDGTPNLVYTFTRTGSTTSALTVNYTVGGNATFNSDYTQIGAASFTATTGSITFAAGSSTATLTIDPTGDTLVEQNETVALTLASGTGYTLGTTTAVTGTITNDDLPSISLSTAQTIIEGLTNPQNLTYTVSLSNPSSQPITVQYATANVNATAGLDYTNTTGTLTFNPSVTSQVLNIPILNDNLHEGNETFVLNLTNPTNATLGTNSVTTTITDTLTASVTTILPANVEFLTLTGTEAINGTGNANNNRLTGNSANNTLDGGAGSDTLIGLSGNDILVGGAGSDTLAGGVGQDSFTFNSPNEGLDLINDFNVIDDTIAVSAAGFVAGLTSNAAITAAQFGLGATATTPRQRFIYNSSNGALLFDSDGSNSTIASIQIATLSTGLALTNQDIFVNA